MATRAIYVSDDELVRQATAAAQAGEIPRAAQLLAEACLINPSNSSAWLWRASIAQSPGETQGYLEAALRVDPSNSTARKWLTTLTAAAAPEPEPPRHCPFCSHGTDTVSTRCPSCRGVMHFDIDLIGSNDQVHRPQMRFAAGYYEQFGRTTPDVPLRIALCHLNLLSWQAALEELRTAVALGADDPDVFDTFGRLQAMNFVLIIGAKGERRDDIALAFDEAGYRSLAVERRSEAFTAIQRELPSLVVIDMTQGCDDGFVLCREIRDLPRTAATPVIVATKGGIFDSIRSRHAGATVLLPGSPAPQTLVEAAGRRAAVADATAELAVA